MAHGKRWHLERRGGRARALLRAIRDSARGTEGSIALEFAIVLPVFLTLVFGILQFGALLFVFNNMQNAAREAAREFAVGKLADKAQAKAYAERYLASWGLVFAVTVTAPGELPAPDDHDVVVVVSVPAAAAALVGYPPIWGQTVISARATFRDEGD